MYKHCTPGELCRVKNAFDIRYPSVFHLGVDCHRKQDIPNGVLRDLEMYSKQWRVPYKIINERTDMGLLPKDILKYRIRLCYRQKCVYADKLFEDFPEKTGRAVKKLISR